MSKQPKCRSRPLNAKEGVVSKRWRATRHAKCPPADYKRLVGADEEKERGCYLAAGEHQFSTELLRTVLNQPFRSIVTVFSAGRPGVFRRKTVPNRHHCHLEVVGHVFQIRILAVKHQLLSLLTRISRFFLIFYCESFHDSLSNLAPTNPFFFPHCLFISPTWSLQYRFTEVSKKRGHTKLHSSTPTLHHGCAYGSLCSSHYSA
jgi:hypothetical protein